MDPPCHVHELKNGMKVVMVPRKTSGLIYISLVMRNGRIDETKHTWSYTHMGEHLLAKFTSKKFPKFEGVKGQLGFLGIENNAYTGNFDTGYWLLGHKKHAPFIIRLLSSVYYDYKFTDNWQKQRNIVMEEIKSRSSDHWTPLIEMISKTLYPNHRLSTTWKEELKCISHASESDVTRFLLNKLDPRVTLILIEGDFEIGLLLPELTKAFDRPKSDIHYQQLVTPVTLFKGPKLIRCPVPSSVVSKIVYIYQLPKMSRFDNKLDAVIMMMMRYFCIGYYSRLYQVLREKNGLIYGLESSYELSPVPDILPGELTINIQVDPQHVKSVLEIVDNEIDRLKQFVVPRKEMLRLKNSLQFQRSMEILNKRPGKYVDNCAYYVTWNQPVQTYTEYFEQLHKVKSREIQGVAKRIFCPEHKLVAIGEGGEK